MLKKLTITLLFSILVTALASFIQYFYHVEILVSHGQSKELVHKVNGKPCASLFYKGNGYVIQGKRVNSYDIWVSPQILGSSDTTVHYNLAYKVELIEKEFIWFYEPLVSNWKRDTDGCHKTLK